MYEFITRLAIILVFSLVGISFAGFIIRHTGRFLIEYYFERKSEVLTRLEAEFGAAVSTRN